jgi:hypothetical protein
MYTPCRSTIAAANYGATANTVNRGSAAMIRQESKPAHPPSLLNLDVRDGFLCHRKALANALDGG